MATSDQSPSAVPHDHPACLAVEELLKDCDVRRTRASGPGGQHRNKVETAIEITHRPTGVVASASERRSQEQNRQVAVKRLRLALAVQHRTARSDMVEPSALWFSRCVASRIQCNDRHQDFAALMAEALNAVHAKVYDLRKAAASLGCSSSQLIRFLARTPDALNAVNRERQALGLGKLRG
ncbi:MAG: peptide chain release factor-like protein [Fuerstiella sp.]|nr:peptide chain release factor-like protein [Fuerstiella sp.]MCP4856343.1 peptide chain release factor-like protein [Fuerstiella sp.]